MGRLGAVCQVQCSDAALCLRVYMLCVTTVLYVPVSQTPPVSLVSCTASFPFCPCQSQACRCTQYESGAQPPNVNNANESSQCKYLMKKKRCGHKGSQTRHSSVVVNLATNFENRKESQCIQMLPRHTRTVANLLCSLAPDAVVVHYVSPGYHHEVPPHPHRLGAVAVHKQYPSKHGLKPSLQVVPLATQCRLQSKAVGSDAITRQQTVSLTPSPSTQPAGLLARPNAAAQGTARTNQACDYGSR